MRNFLLSLYALLCAVSLSVAQHSHQSLTIKTYDGNANQTSIAYLTGEDAEAFDINAYIEKSEDLSRITVDGLSYNDEEVTKIHFDSDDLESGFNGIALCETTETRIDPFLGLESKSSDNELGTEIVRIIDDSPASAGELHIGEEIFTFNGIAIYSFCDLKYEVGQTEVGQEVAIEVFDGQDYITKTVVMGGRPHHSMGYTYCEGLELNHQSAETIYTADLTTYPNPSNSIVNIEFKTDSPQDAVFIILDMKGNVVYRTVYSDHVGNINTSYKFENEAEGMYLFSIEQGESLFIEKVNYIKK